MFRITLPGPGDTGVLKRHEGRVTVTAHPGTISNSWEILRPGPCERPAHVSTCNFPGACCKGASFFSARCPTLHRVLVLKAFVSSRSSAACELQFLCSTAPREFTCTPNQLSCTTTPCIDPHEFLTACMSRVSVRTTNVRQSQTHARHV